MENISMDFLGLIYENIKKTFISQQTYLYLWVTDIMKFYEVLLCKYCKGLFCLSETLCLYLYSSTYA